MSEPLKLESEPDNGEKPLSIFDVETTGVDPASDRIIQIGISRLVDGAPLFYNQLIYPGFDISPRITELTGITNEMLKGKPRFEDVAEKIYPLVSDCALVGYNLLNFDIPILWEEFNRCLPLPAGPLKNVQEWKVELPLVIDVGNLYKKLDPRTLAAAVKKYCGRDHEGAHDALEDVIETGEVLFSMERVHPELQGLSQRELAKFSKLDDLEGQPVDRVDLAGTLVRDEKGIVRFTHKKVRGVPVADDMGYARWMLGAGFSENTKSAIRDVLDELHDEGR